ncbi:MAG: hypothetical protein NTW62_01590 [Candidatus Nomurabacteria bacterium]|nr:hypothetical protein [Candidatus Nomurabacteria bacterium]
MKKQKVFLIVTALFFVTVFSFGIQKSFAVSNNNPAPHENMGGPRLHGSTRVLNNLRNHSVNFDVKKKMN